ncbi:MAG TPA: shikimate kinase [Candidatus Limiplasma sp.]|nr:shikimate kinase [Candidatus Limiplasma sp.]
MRYGLIGEKLGHSHSPRLHALLGDESYALMPVARDALDGLLKNGDFLGLNVTIPYKRAVIPYCAELGETARQIGSVNTLVRRADGSLFGDNTDAFGFAKMAESAGIDFAGKKALVLGSGGTSLTACYVIRKAGGEAVVISREGENNYACLDRHSDADVLVNATPVGMYPQVEQSPVNLERFARLSGVLDVVYNPLRTRLLLQAEALGIPRAGGLTMLVWQAVRARELFEPEHIPPGRVQYALSTLRREISNLVLIGMPGCGKTTVGQRCASALGWPLIDTDTEIENRAGKAIPQIFADDGEPAFRALESQVIAELGRGCAKVISTGGGAILSPENRHNLKMNGVVIRLMRPLEKLTTGGRPLSKDLETLRRMETNREPHYAACADRTVRNDGTLDLCVQKVLEGFDEALRD